MLLKLGQYELKEGKKALSFSRWYVHIQSLRTFPLVRWPCSNSFVRICMIVSSELVFYGRKDDNSSQSIWFGQWYCVFLTDLPSKSQVILKLSCKKYCVFLIFMLSFIYKYTFCYISSFNHLFTSMYWQKCSTQLPVVQEVGCSMVKSVDMKVCENSSCIWKGMFLCSTMANTPMHTKQEDRAGCIYHVKKHLFQKVLQNNTKWLRCTQLQATSPSVATAFEAIAPTSSIVVNT